MIDCFITIVYFSLLTFDNFDLNFDFIIFEIVSVSIERTVSFKNGDYVTCLMCKQIEINLLLRLIGAGSRFIYANEVRRSFICR